MHFAGLEKSQKTLLEFYIKTLSNHNELSSVDSYFRPCLIFTGQTGANLSGASTKRPSYGKAPIRDFQH
jgi:hypothetical protein